MNENSISQRLKIALDLADGLKQADLVRQMGLRPSSVSLWFSGKNTPDVENLSKLAVLLNVSFEWLATGRGNVRLEQTNSVGMPTASQQLILTSDQTELLSYYARLAPAKRKGLLAFLKTLLE